MGWVAGGACTHACSRRSAQRSALRNRGKFRLTVAFVAFTTVVAFSKKSDQVFIEICRKVRWKTKKSSDEKMPPVEAGRAYACRAF